METLGATWLIFCTQLSTILRSKRALACLVLALAPGAITLAAGLADSPPHGPTPSEVVWYVGIILLLQLIAPLIGLVAGASILTEEIENRTITYAFTRPVPRISLFLGRYLATLVLVVGLLAMAATSVVLLAPSRGGEGSLAPEMMGALITASVLGGAVYAMITGALGVFLKRPMVVGLFYLVAMEGFLANLPGSSQKMTIQFYLRGIFTRLGVSNNPALREYEFINRTEFLSPTDSAVRILIFMALALGLATWGIRRRQYVLTS